MYNDYSIRLEPVKGFFVVGWFLRVKPLFEENSGESLFAGQWSEKRNIKPREEGSPRN